MNARNFWKLILFTSVSLSAQDTGSESDIRTLIEELQAMVHAQQTEIESQRSEIRALKETVAAQDRTFQSLPIGESSLAGSEPTSKKSVTGRLPSPLKAETEPKVSSRFNLDFYGYVKLDASYDSQRTYYGDEAFYALPKSGNGDDDSFSMTAKQTRFGMKVSAPEFEGWESRGGIEFDFYGSASDNAPNPRFRLGYLELEKGPWTVLAGQHYDAWNTILPKTVNFATMGQQGALWSRRPQVRVSRQFGLGGDHVLIGTLGAARNIGEADIDVQGDGLDGGEDFGMPMVQWNLKYMPKGTDSGPIFALGGHFGKEEVERTPTDREANYDTSLVMATVHLPLHSSFNLSGAVWTGQNLGKFKGGVGQSLNLTQDTEIATTGGWVQACWFANEDLNINLGYGLDDPDDSDLSNGGRIRNETVFTNLYWSFLPSTTFAIEYQVLNTDYKNAEDATTHRIQSALIYKF